MIAIAVGAMLGSSLRYLLSTYNNIKHGLGTLLANLLGCVCLAIVVYLIPSNYHLFFIVGFCGSLTTFSTFCFELYEKINHKHYQSVVIYCLLTFILSFILFWWIA